MVCKVLYFKHYALRLHSPLNQIYMLLFLLFQQLFVLYSRADIDENDSSHCQYAEQLLNQLLAEMEKKSNEMDFLTRLKFHEIIKQLNVSMYERNNKGFILAIAV